MRQISKFTPVPFGLIVQGPLIEVVLSCHPIIEKFLQSKGKISPVRQVTAMVDTGASITSFEDRILRDLGLTPIRKMMVTGVSQKTQECPVYRMAITIDFPADKNGGRGVFLSDVVGMPSPKRPQKHVGLIGRDFLRYLKLVYDGPKATIELIEYSMEATALKSKKSTSPALPKKKKSQQKHQKQQKVQQKKKKKRKRKKKRVK